VLFRGDWYSAVRVNRTWVSVPARIGGAGWTDTIRYSGLGDVGGAADLHHPQLVAVAVAARQMAGHRALHPAWQALAETPEPDRAE